MPAKRLPFVPSGALNTANSPVQTGQAEPITGLALPSGLDPGDYFDMTEAEANAYSNAAVGQLHAGRYMWVQLDAAAVIAGNGALQRGQGLYWKQGGATPYLVTNVNPAGATGSPIIGVFLNTAPGGAFPVTPGNWFFMQVLSPGRATVKMVAAALTAPAPAIGDSICGKIGAAAADAALFDDVSGLAAYSASIDAFLGSFAGTAEGVPASGALVIVDIKVAGPAVQ